MAAWRDANRLWFYEGKDKDWYMPFSRREFLSGSIIATAALAARAQSAWSTAVNVQTAIDAAVKASINSGACPGVALKVYRHGQLMIAGNYGLANIETHTPVSDDSIFRIGSLTKQFTAALILKLAADRRLKLDDSVSKILSFFSTEKPFTLRELLNHTAGLHDDEETVSCPAGSNGYKTQIQLAEAIVKQKILFDFDPGTAWFYSNTNYIVLGAVVEKITGLPLAQAASQMIFLPLGLHATAFDTSSAVVKGRVDGYTSITNVSTGGNGGSFAHAPFIEISDAGGAGAMRSTAGDLCKWHRALFSNQVLPSDFVQAMMTPGRLRDGRLSGTHRFSSADANYGDVQYAMGLLVPPAAPGHRSVMHYGFINGFAACLESFIDVGLTAVILCNGDMGPGMPIRDLRRIIASRIVSTLSPVLRGAVATRSV